MNKFYLTTPIYYTTGKPHIGHAFTTIYADVIARYNRLKNKEVFFSVGTDEHGAKIAEKAAFENKTPQSYVDEIFSYYKKTWQVLNINYDDFIRTTEERHKKGVLEFIKKLIASGDIYKDKYEGLYCVGCENFLTEKELINGFCPDHLKPPLKVSEENFFFNLNKHLSLIREKIESGELKITPESRRNETLKLIENGIPNFSISREKVKWGIGYPGEPNQVIYVWVEALINYLTVLNFPTGENYKKFWPADLHIIGAEINKFHTIFWPALLLAINEQLPKEFFIHGLFTVNGQKMSKTLKNIIDPLEMIEKFGSDATRYLLLSQFPASEHGDVKAENFIDKYNADLANGIGNLLERIFAMIRDYGDYSVKEVDLKIKDFQEKTEFEYFQKMYNHQLYEALAIIFSFIKGLDRYINQTEPWKLIKKKNPEADKILATLILGAENIIKWLKPFMPLKIEQAENYLKESKFRTEKLNLFPRI